MNRLALFLVLALVGAFVVGGGLLVRGFLSQDDEPEPQAPIAQVDPELENPPLPAERLEDPPVPVIPVRDVIEPPVVISNLGPEVEFNPGDPGSIFGVIVNSSGTPVSGAKIELAQGPEMVITMPSLRTSTDFATESDGSGQFRLTGIPPADDYLVIAEHPEYGSGNIGPFELVAAGSHDTREIKLRPGGRVRGFVTFGGRAIIAAEVRLDSTTAGFGAQQDEEKQKFQAVETDAEGYYAFETVSFKNFQITVTARGFGSQTKTNAAFLETRIEQQINFELTAESVITGFVYDKNRRPIEGAKVLASLSGASFRSEGKANTGRDGSFVVEGLSEGQYHLNATAQGFSPSNKPRIESGTSNVEMEMLPQGSVVGNVIDEITGANLDSFQVTVLRSFRGREPASTGPIHKFSGTSGHFEVQGLDPSSYVLEAKAPGYAACRSDEFTTQRGEVTEGVIVKMNKGGAVAGRVVNESGDPVKGARVVLNTNQFKWNPVHDIIRRMTNERGGKLKTRTDAEGNYLIEMIVPGVYQIAAEHKTFSAQAVNDIAVRKNEVTTVPDISMNQGARVDGFCYDEDGLILAGASVTAVSTKNDYFTGRCDNDGHFELRGLPAGDYTVSINSYVSDPPENVLLQMLKAKNSAKKVSLTDAAQISLELRLSTESNDPR